ncbi:MAG: geranylgeranylglyceryl/heptaprenylglyceryl phosphate synthase [Nitrosopumilales archaeon CG15_BIG_FIL_POST_REV_8_21_14_020_33_23]|jgi:phosphoglycerol geranylgeranyltransferase|nr:MAG: geranylgeranylglyceryl/heptaprenylglyceryl phosphate synthase [Nitrosopumilales archaeon CG11_big_fil_rev_8_21_14_0_20_33_24]PIN97071.1 MAG: geranylgeranylglyceryl/heptaprenylglyceryl phosphate synthase [Nitrosopumilus sp. CG10_big_fil_rev_8_21_14_0_10_33_7]PIW35573.1 MAG: geranylgeranylglyceryl/heptaprenylglyceryl phosphate synthase [Nitrosopumilales archaeon CG15_BIG_FIL_POST_REV_8_21_14_020_33_23]PIY88868.1 MAG: geranylgeranylglyceryl/heptaprenylglyceryl phosphate synthase [Nitrosopum
MTGNKVESFLKSELKKKNALLFVLIDSEESKLESSQKLAQDVEKIGASAILVGGSSATDQIEMAKVVKGIKKGIKIPIILFPGNITGVVPDADAILFSSLMNSENPYFITQAQALGAPSVLKFGLEPLPTAYLVIGDGTSAWFVGSARGIPFEKPKIAAAYALAAQFLGMRFVYLEAGSGAKSSVTPEMVKTVRKAFNGFLIVGGGIKDAKTASELVKAGANALVIGTFLEKGGSIKKLAEITKAIQRSK